MNPLLCNNGLIPTTTDIEEDKIIFTWNDFKFSHQETTAIYRIRKYCTILNNAYYHYLKIDKKESYEVNLCFTGGSGLWRGMTMNDHKNGITIAFSNIRSVPDDRMIQQYVTDLKIYYTLNEEKKKEMKKKYKG